MQTAQILGDKLNIEVQKTEALREMGFGVWEGLLIKEIQKDYSDIYATWRNEPHLVNIPEGETLKIIKERFPAAHALHAVGHRHEERAQPEIPHRSYGILRF